MAKRPNIDMTAGIKAAADRVEGLYRAVPDTALYQGLMGSLSAALDRLRRAQGKWAAICRDLDPEPVETDGFEDDEEDAEERDE